MMDSLDELSNVLAPLSEQLKIITNELYAAGGGGEQPLYGRVATAEKKLAELDARLRQASESFDSKQLESIFLEFNDINEFLEEIFSELGVVKAQQGEDNELHTENEQEAILATSTFHDAYAEVYSERKAIINSIGEESATQGTHKLTEARYSNPVQKAEVATDFSTPEDDTFPKFVLSTASEKSRTTQLGRNPYKFDAPINIANATLKSARLHPYGLRIGSLCLFPKRQFNGTISHRLGQVADCTLAADHSDAGSNDTSNEEDVDLVLIIYAAPQTLEESPCRYLENLADCKFREKCRFHHGVWIRVEDLSPFEWDPMKSVKVEERVIAKYKDRLWYEGAVKSINVDDTPTHHCDLSTLHGIQCITLTVLYDPPYSHVHTVKLRNVLPIVSVSDVRCSFEDEKSFSRSKNNTIPNDDDSSSVENKAMGSSIQSGSNESGTDSNDPNWLQAQLSRLDAPEDFGCWMKYSNAFGLKMLQKMGYEVGGTLGARNRPKELGEALATPIPIKIIPPGRSLDFIRKTAPKKRGKRGSGWVRLATKHGEEYGTSSQGTQRRGMFGLLNAGLMDGYSGILDKAAKAQRIEENSHKHGISVLRRSAISESELRKRLLDCREKIKAKESSASESRAHLDRHDKGPAKDRNSLLVDDYRAAFFSKTNELRRLKEEESALQARLQALKATKNLKSF